ncbi:MFS transporter [Fulvimarina sp. 2208YS6-2-32]|uniref:MFS transporter n=1 Tax=Fulvimarina uroteuthidis TaxID=3098149 RepID=A0ABU5I2K7_9HYPH|nr:MFS transporter [Fulvimarina sp. 2208YS6-2-32]MDY8109607.1 MFS transporter [Fulvimarina sp. 2208YS6-2-32]
MNPAPQAPGRQDVHGARLNALVLAGAQAVCGAATPIAISTGGLAGTWLLADDKSLATLPVTAYNVGVALGALPAAFLMRTVGRRYGFVTGALVLVLGALIGAAALSQQSFVIFALALLVLGLSGAFVQQYRFAATDGAPLEYQSTAISIVLVGGIGAAVIGPQTVRYTSALFLPIEFAGSFLALALLGLVGAAILSLVRFPRPVPRPKGAAPILVDTGRPLREIVTQRRFVVALICGVGTFALMSFVMTGAPLAIVGCGLPMDISFLGIQWHVLAMFGPSLVTGRLIRRFGAETIVGCGLCFTALSAGVFLSGLEIWNFWLGLVLLGLGWNFGFIGATTMVASVYRPQERAKTQGFHDFVLFGLVALASFMSGKTYVGAGWGTMNWIVLPVVAVCLLVLIWDAALGARQRRSA